jgi:hypothetical protein
LSVRFVRGFGRFWYDFIIGDDWRIALGVVAVLALAAAAVASDALPHALIVIFGALAIALVTAISIVIEVRRSRC